MSLKIEDRQQPDRQQGACFPPRAMQLRAQSSPGGELPGVVLPHQHSELFWANPHFFEQQFCTDELEGFVNKENFFINRLWDGFAELMVISTLVGLG